MGWCLEGVPAHKINFNTLQVSTTELNFLTFKKMFVETCKVLNIFSHRCKQLVSDVAISTSNTSCRLKTNVAANLVLKARLSAKFSI